MCSVCDSMKPGQNAVPRSSSDCKTDKATGIAQGPVALTLQSKGRMGEEEEGDDDHRVLIVASSFRFTASTSPRLSTGCAHYRNTSSWMLVSVFPPRILKTPLASAHVHAREFLHVDVSMQASIQVSAETTDPEGRWVERCTRTCSKRFIAASAARARASAAPPGPPPA